MKKFITACSLALLLGSASIAPVKAQSPPEGFFVQHSGKWSVVGIYGKKADRTNDTCMAKSIWQNGASISLLKDLEDDELYMIYQHPNIKFTNTSPANTVFLNFLGKDMPENGIKIQQIYEVFNDSTIRIRAMNQSVINEFFATAREMQLIFTGTIPIIRIDLEGTSRAVKLIGYCKSIYHDKYENAAAKTSPAMRIWEPVR